MMIHIPKRFTEHSNERDCVLYKIHVRVSSSKNFYEALIFMYLFYKLYLYHIPI